MAKVPENTLHFPPPRPIRLELTPVQVATALSHLPELVFFDSAGNLASRSQQAISIIAAKPTRILKGHIHDADNPVSERLAQYQALSARHPAEHPQGLPAGGLCGWIDYEGDYCFGEFPEMLIYQHHNQQWWQCGRLSESMKPTPAPLKAPRIGEFKASMSRQEYEEKVRRIHDYIAAGDIYQVNLTQQFTTNYPADSLFPLYHQLRQSTPAPLASWIHLAQREILSSSPETFLRISQRQIETRPIKGTRPRGHTPQTDADYARELLDSPKEKAELTMITDLERNDIGQVCEFGSVRVEEMLALEKLEQVFHLVSTVSGKLRPELDHWQALKACFPGGSITGAPKKRAMEIISELEPVPRGLYTGAVGYLGFNGESQFNIAIRTLVRENNLLSYHVGAGIVADSDPAAEYQETLDKAKGLRLAISRHDTL